KLVIPLLDGGAAPEPPALPRRWGCERGHLLARAGKPTPEPPGAARAHFDRPPGQTLAAPGEPGVARRVPDRGDDLTPELLHNQEPELLERHRQWPNGEQQFEQQRR